MKPSVIVTVIFLTLVSLLHLVRFAFQVDVIVQEHVVPPWLSLVSFLFLVALAGWLWNEARTG